MSRFYLYGPVDHAFAEQNLFAPRQSGACLSFHHQPGVADLTIAPADTWEAVRARLPDGWRPDFVALNLSYTSVPACLWSSPLPLLGLAGDWPWNFHWFRQALPLVDGVLTDTRGVEVLARLGYAHARVANFFGAGRAYLEETDTADPSAERDLDVVFVGNLHPAVQRERLAWLGRLARLADRYRVGIATAVFGDDYRRRLRRAKIILNRSARGECNRRVFEAALCGALLFQESDNAEVPASFRDRQECVYYDDDNLEGLLDYFLGHDDERQRIAAAGKQKARQCGFATLWQEVLDRLEPEWPAWEERARRRVEGGGRGPGLLARVWQALGGVTDPTLATDLSVALSQRPTDAGLHNALGLAVGGMGGGAVTEREAGLAAVPFRQALAADPDYLPAGLNLAFALVALGQAPPAVELARQMLATLHRRPTLPPEFLEAVFFPPAFDLFRVEWERAAYAHAGRPAEEATAKQALLRWRLHELLAELTGDLVHYHEAALARPDLPATRGALGCALARAERQAEAVPHLRRAVDGNPFDLPAARALYQVLHELGDDAGKRDVARDCRLLAQAAPGVVAVEPWFAAEPPAGDELASVILPCCNEVEYTRRCLDSVLAHTRPPYEIILVDNDSTDATPALAEALKARPGPARVAVLHNATNRGFPAACNQGLAEAKGRYLVLLNNDTVVTAGWLEGLIGWALHDWPSVGLVGPVTNCSRPPQEVPVDYAGPDGLEAFAGQRRWEFARRALNVERLTGFCLLIRREVLDQVGLLDERYGVGFFEDDDLCVRARRAGFRLLVALDVFVHHFGSRTFAGLGIDCPRALAENFAVFRAKWGPEESAGYTLPGATAAGEAGPEGMQVEVRPGTTAPLFAPGAVRRVDLAAYRGRVSLCLIVKDEEGNLPDCLRSAADLVDEIIVVDTGSADRTKEIAQALGARVFDFIWVDSFAAARNESLRHATGDWIFWMDADDRLDDDSRGKLQALFASLKDEHVAYVMQCRCLPEPDSGVATTVDHVRLFRNHPALRWTHRVHEQILPAVRATGGTVRRADVVIQHTGYLDRALRRRKLERDLRLLRLELAEQPNHPFTLFNLGNVLQDLGQLREALDAYRRSLAGSDPSASIVRKLYASVADGHRRLGEWGQAVDACREGRRFYPEDAELLAQEGLARRGLGDAEGAIACWRRALEGREEPDHFASVADGLGGYRTRHYLAELYRDRGQQAEAEAEWRAALAEHDGFTLAWLGLGELYRKQRRWPELEAVIAHLAAAPATGDEAELLQAERHLAEGEFAPARELVEGVIGRRPRAVWARELLSHALIQEGTDWDAAEQALREVLTLDPSNAAAQQNLAVLLRQQGRTPA